MTISLSFDSLRYRFRAVISSSGLVTSVTVADRNPTQSFGLLAFSFCSTSYTSAFFSILITEGNFVVWIGNFAASFSCKLSYKGNEHDPAFTCDIRCCRHRLCSVIHKQNSLSTSLNHGAFFRYDPRHPRPKATTGTGVRHDITGVHRPKAIHCFSDGTASMIKTLPLNGHVLVTRR
jgi:hypothetical protein